jgi:hypothetical protein
VSDTTYRRQKLDWNDCATTVRVAILSPMANHIITPKQTRLEKIETEVKGFSPQVKAALITVSVTVAIALITSIGGFISMYSESSRLKSKVNDLELEVLPFRSLAVQQFNKADAESLKKLAESMTTLHRDYSNQLGTINNLRQQIEQLKAANDETDRKLFSKAIHEKISSANTNSFFKRRTTEGAWRVIVKLQATPIPGSFRGSIAGPYAIDDRTLPNSTIKNLFFQTFVGAWADFPPNMPFHMEYVADSRETNLVERVEFVSDNVVLLDGSPVIFK